VHAEERLQSYITAVNGQIGQVSASLTAKHIELDSKLTDLISSLQSEMDSKLQAADNSMKLALDNLGARLNQAITDSQRTLQEFQASLRAGQSLRASLPLAFGSRCM
jgi:ABC-type transporter Mla subunit MlaD